MIIKNIKVAVDINEVKFDNVNIILPSDLKTEWEIKAYLHGKKLLIIPLNQHIVTNSE